MTKLTLCRFFRISKAFQSAREIIHAGLMAVGFSWAHSALKWYRRNENIQAEVEEMQEEQRSLSSIRSVSVWGLLTDRCVRWQVITIAVVNVGMQLSGIDAVSLNCVCVCLNVCNRRHTHRYVLAHLPPPYVCTSIFPHALSGQGGGGGATGPRLIVFWPSPSVLSIPAHPVFHFGIQPVQNTLSSFSP